MSHATSSRVLFLSSEVAPFAKVGGLADVAGSLPPALAALGAEILVAMPAYGSIETEQLAQEIFSLTITLRGEERFPSFVKGVLPRSTVPVLFFQDEEYFGSRQQVYGYPDDPFRFLYFSLATLEAVKRIGFRPDVIHCNDWQTGMIPVLLRTLYKDDPFFASTATVFTIHNIAYQGVAPVSLLERVQVMKDTLCSLGIDARDNDINFLYEALFNADMITTVSPTYAEEILTSEYGKGMESLLLRRKDRLQGIVNGIDRASYNPEMDPALPHTYTASTLEQKEKNKTVMQQFLRFSVSSAPLFGMVTRIAEQKGIDLLLEQLPWMLEEGAQVVILGTGEPALETQLLSLQSRYPHQLAVLLSFDEAFARRIYGASDFFLMPSRFEPCGLGQMIAMRYGSVPIVRSTGGLKDTVLPWDGETKKGTGFVFTGYGREAFSDTLRAALSVYHQGGDGWITLRKQAMEASFGWSDSAQRYRELYNLAVTYRTTGVSDLSTLCILP
jgi:starch synthase